MAAVALLVVVVYLTLLRPDGPGTLRGHRGPRRRVDLEGRQHRPNESGPQAEDTARALRGPGGAGIGGAGISGAGISGAGRAARRRRRPSAPARGPLGASRSDPSPSDDQYDDSVKSLLDKVAAGGAISD